MKRLFLLFILLVSKPLWSQNAQRLKLEISSDLKTWKDVPLTAGMLDANGRIIVPAESPSQFFRMRLETSSAPGSDMALIPGGTFTMGRTSGDMDTNSPPVTVNVSAFYLAKYEVTKVLWDEVHAWGAVNGYTDIGPGGGKAPNHPVQSVTWWDVVKWCNARSEKEGQVPVYSVSGAVMRTGTTAPEVNWSASGYRLPTEAEWEKAARGGLSGLRFPGGDSISHSQANFRNFGGESYATGTTSYHPIYATGSHPYTAPVGSFAMNGYGLHDMEGNVWEWCWDWYGESTYVSGVTDPRGANSGSGRVFRGGGWHDAAFWSRNSKRDSIFPHGSDNRFGFRLARSLVP